MSLLKKYLQERTKEKLKSNTTPKENSISDEHRQQQQQVQCSSHEEQLNLQPINFENNLKIFDLDDESLPVPFDQISYIPNAITESCGKAMLEYIKNGNYEWTYLKTRKLLCFGGLPEQDRKREELPQWLSELSTVLVNRNIFPEDLAPNHVLVNQYQPGEGIMHHTDGPLYLDRVVIISLGYPSLMSFKPRLKTENIGEDYEDNVERCANDNCINILLRPNSLLFFSKEAYSSWLHGIDKWDSVLPGHETIDDAFKAYISNKENIIDKASVSESNFNHDDESIRTSLTIRHMF